MGSCTRLTGVPPRPWVGFVLGLPTPVLLLAPPILPLFPPLPSKRPPGVFRGDRDDVGRPEPPRILRTLRPGIIWTNSSANSNGSSGEVIDRPGSHASFGIICFSVCPSTNNSSNKSNLSESLINELKNIETKINDVMPVSYTHLTLPTSG